jgi:hypothetical protein
VRALSLERLLKDVQIRAVSRIAAQQRKSIAYADA